MISAGWKANIKQKKKIWWLQLAINYLTNFCKKYIPSKLEMQCKESGQFSFVFLVKLMACLKQGKF